MFISLNHLSNCTSPVMKRVSVSMEDSLRDEVRLYSKERSKTMPQTYRELIELGLFSSPYEVESYSIPDEVKQLTGDTNE